MRYVVLPLLALSEAPVAYRRSSCSPGTYIVKVAEQVIERSGCDGTGFVEHGLGGVSRFFSEWRKIARHPVLAATIVYQK